MDKIYLDFSLLPEGKYLVEKVQHNERTKEEKVIDSETGIYTLSAPAPLCFIDLFLTDPMPGITHNGIYPVRNLFDSDPEIVEVTYKLRFLARKTLWNYFIVPQPQRPLDDLSIISESGPEFIGPCAVVLANGAKAYRFLSEEPIPLHRQSSARFQLVSDGAVLAKRLPVASIQQVLPRSEWTACRDLLASLQPGADDWPPCHTLYKTLCKGFCKGENPQECAKKIRNLGEQKSGPNSNAKEFHNRNYSDIFVYV